MGSDVNIVDIFEREQNILDNAVKQSNLARSGQPFDIEEYYSLAKEYGKLLKQLRRMTRIYDKVTENLNTSKQDLLDKVQYDGLTGIYNRRYMEDNFSKIMEAYSGKDRNLSVMMLDIDYFKRYNDTYGHSEGDECLRKVAKTISESLTRRGDFAARYGGEEFAVILPDTDKIASRIIANRILENIRALHIPHENNEAADYVTISIGGISALTQIHRTKEDFMKKADEALYLSKNQGRNRYTFIEF